MAPATTVRNRMNVCVIIAPIPHCYQSKVIGLSNYFASHHIHSLVLSVHEYSSYHNVHFTAVISVWAGTALNFLRSSDSVCDYLISMATYYPNSLFNSKGPIPLPPPPTQCCLSAFVLIQSIFISEHDSPASNIAHFSHHTIDSVSTVVSIPWCLTDDEVTYIENNHSAFPPSGPIQSHQIDLSCFTSITYVGLVQEKLLPILSFIKTYHSLLPILCVGPDANIISTYTSTIKVRQTLLARSHFLPYIYSRSLIGHLLLSIHHSFELNWQSTYNERAFKALACGIPLLVDNPISLTRRFPCTIHQLPSGSNQNPIFFLERSCYLSPHSISYKHVLPTILDPIIKL